MRILLASFLPLVVATLASSHQENVSFRTHDVPTVLATDLEGEMESRLRGRSQALESAVSSLQQSNALQEIPDVIDFGELSPSERIEKVDQLQATLNTWVSKLTEVELLAVQNGVQEFTSILRSAQNQLQKLDKPVATIVRLLDQESQQNTTRRLSEENAVALGEDGAMTAQISRAQRKKERQNKRKEKKKEKEDIDQHKKEKQAYRRMFEHQRNKAKTLHQSHVHLKMVDIQEAIYNGDFAKAHDFTNSIFQSHYARHGKKEDTASEGHGRRLDKAGMCRQLVDCASKMSKYDMFVYFYSDDIDPTTGDVDENVVKYDEKDLNAKYDKIKKLASEETCDDLLMQFHRTKENGIVPSWEGASVGQVCMAEGTPSFVKLEAAARTMSWLPKGLMQKVLDSPEDLSKGANSERRHELDLIFKRTTGNYEDLVSMLVVEPLQCAEAMHTKGIKGGREPFPFGEEGKPVGLAGNTEVSVTPDGSLDFVRFPTYKGKETFPNLPPVDEGWRRKLATKTSQSTQRMLEGTNRARFKITLKNMYLERNGDSGSEAEPYGDLWVNVNGAKTNLWKKTASQAVDIRERGTHNINKEHIVEDFDLNGNLEVGGHLWEEDNGSDDDFGTKTRRVNDGPGDFYLEYRDGKTILKVNWRVERTMITLSPTPAPTQAVKIEVIDSGEARNEYGQIRNNQVSPYNGFVPYLYLLNQYKFCSKSLADEVMEDLVEKEEKGEDYDLQQVLKDDFFDKFFEDCQSTFFGAMREGLELVFGDRTSTGFICGMKEVIVNDEKEMPGTCCLDAPYELSGDDWGTEYQCPVEGQSAKCKNYGPFFSGMATQSCDSYGGTWCPNKVDCSMLRDCIDKYKDESKEQYPSFYDYLDSSPAIQNPKDFKQCGRSRQYFGYDEYFSNDAQVCESIGQLQQMNDLSFIDEFYGTGSDKEDTMEVPDDVAEPEYVLPETKTNAPGKKGSPPELPDVEEAATAEPDTTGSQNPLVLSGIEWANSIFAQQQVLEGISSSLSFADNVACPWIPMVGTFPCDIIKVAVKYALLVVEKVTAALLKISEFMNQMKAKIDNIMPIKEAEEVEAVEENVVVTAEHVTATTNVVNQYIYDSVELLFEDIFEKNEALSKYLYDLDEDQKKVIETFFEKQTDYMKEVDTKNSEALLQIRKDVGGMEKECVNKIIPGISFDMQAEITSKGASKSFVVVTTGLDGKPTKPDFFNIKSVGGDGTSSIVPDSEYTTKKIGSVGEQMIRFAESVEEKIFIVDAGLHEGNSDEELVTKMVLLSFM